MFINVVSVVAGLALVLFFAGRLVTGTLAFWPCHEVAHLTASITRSFETLKVRTLEGFILHELLEGRAKETKTEQLAEILKLYKK